jgi:hypothetical protein
MREIPGSGQFAYFARLAERFPLAIAVAEG